jgi:hypothetical protein
LFLPTSRYARTPQIQVTLDDGTQVSAVELRVVPATPGDLTAVTSNDRLDVIAQRMYADGTRYWHIADANTALESKHLLLQWLPNDQNAQPLRIRIPEN